jgi:hypothetical protein
VGVQLGMHVLEMHVSGWSSMQPSLQLHGPKPLHPVSQPAPRSPLLLVFEGQPDDELVLEAVPSDPQMLRKVAGPLSSAQSVASMHEMAACVAGQNGSHFAAGARTLQFVARSLQRVGHVGSEEVPPVELDVEEDVDEDAGPVPVVVEEHAAKTRITPGKTSRSIRGW